MLGCTWFPELSTEPHRLQTLNQYLLNWTELKPMAYTSNGWTLTTSPKSIHPQRVEICPLRMIKRMCWGSKECAENQKARPQDESQTVRRHGSTLVAPPGQSGEARLWPAFGTASPVSQSSFHYLSLICSFSFSYRPLSVQWRKSCDPCTVSSAVDQCSVNITQVKDGGRHSFSWHRNLREQLGNVLRDD